MFWTLAQINISARKSNDDGSWMNWEVEMVFDAKSGGILANLPTGKDIYLEARNFRNKVKDGDIKVSADDSQDFSMMISNSTPNKFCLNFKVDVCRGNFPTA